jgi:hypothetical protein
MVISTEILTWHSYRLDRRMKRHSGSGASTESLLIFTYSPGGMAFAASARCILSAPAEDGVMAKE